jgi:hypothetical protein
MVRVLTSYSSEEYGVTSFVMQTERGYVVRLRDDDTEQCMNCSKIFPDLEQAKAYAKRLVSNF